MVARRHEFNLFVCLSGKSNVHKQAETFLPQECKVQ